MTAPLQLPATICLLITRRCNARCRFCFTPPQPHQPSGALLRKRIDWLLTHGASAIHFCGGEPTLHPDLPELLQHVQQQGGHVKLTTNALSLPDLVLAALQETDAHVKVSLHGNPEQHNLMVGMAGFESTVANLRRLRSAGIQVSLQSMIPANGAPIVDWMARFCREQGIKRLSLLPFVPRGKGAQDCEDLRLSAAQRRTLREQAKQKRREWRSWVDIRWLDFNAEPYLIVDTEGRIVQENGTDPSSQVRDQIPEL